MSYGTSTNSWKSRLDLIVIARDIYINFNPEPLKTLLKDILPWKVFLDDHKNRHNQQNDQKPYDEKEDFPFPKGNGNWDKNMIRILK